MMQWPSMPCPLCGGPLHGARCQHCGRDSMTSRRSCTRCRRMTPVAERPCMHCGHRESNPLLWQVPLVILAMILLTALSVALQLVR